MDFDYVQFYLGSRSATQAHFQAQLGFQLRGIWAGVDTETILWQRGQVRLLTTYPLPTSLELSPTVLAQYFQSHPPGVVDIGLRVENLEQVLSQVPKTLIEQPLQDSRTETGGCRWAVLKGWGRLRHTVLERWGDAPFHPAYPLPCSELQSQVSGTFFGFDHAVLNVAATDFERAVAWYRDGFGFVAEQHFDIQTPHSGLVSQVMVHPQGSAQLPINAPTSANSQIQSFLDHYGGSGIQHIALRTEHITQVVREWQQRGLEFLEIPPNYYDQLPQRFPNCQAALDLPCLADQQILVDTQAPHLCQYLLQIFTKPVLGTPTFFWELIERQQQAPGFGAGNFQALFEAIERQERCPSPGGKT